MNKNHLKLLFDIVLTLLFVFLMKTAYTGMLLHELLGLFVGVLFALHKVLNFKWIKAVTSRILQCKANIKSIIMYVVDVVLFVSITTIIVTGIGISQEIFGFWFTNENLDLWAAVHKSAAYFSLALISVHVGLHWEMIMHAAKKILKLRRVSRVRTVLTRIATACIMFAGLHASFEQNFAGNLVEPLTLAGNDTGKGTNTIQNCDSTQPTRLSATAAASSAVVNLSATPSALSGTQPESLEDYLSKLICTGCHKHCPLSAPQCVIGQKQSEQAETAYYTEYSTADDDADTAYNNENDDFVQNTKAPLNGNPLTDYIPIMGLFVAGTHYAVMIPKKLNNNKNAE